MKCKDEVRAGMALLDDYYGDDRWVDKIDLPSLSLTSIRHCVLGQLFGSYGVGTMKLADAGHPVRSDLPFMPGWGMTTTWMLAIRRRRKARRKRMTDALAA